MRYIGRSFDLFTRLRSPWYHKHCFLADAVRVVAFPIWQTPQIRDWADYVKWIELFEYYMILTYRPPRNTHWASWGSPHKCCVNGRRINPNLNHRIAPIKEIRSRSRWRDSFDTRLKLGMVPVQDDFLIRFLPEDGARFLPERWTCCAIQRTRTLYAPHR